MNYFSEIETMDGVAKVVYEGKTSKMKETFTALDYLARLIEKTYNINPLLCPKCNGTMRIISIIEDEVTVKKILMHLNLWNYQYHAHDSSVPVNKENHNQAVKSNRSFEWWEEKASQKNFNTLKDDHVNEYQKWFRRVEIDLGGFQIFGRDLRKVTRH